MDSDEQSSGAEDNEWDFDDEGEDAFEEAQSLFSSMRLESVEAAIRYDIEHFGFDFKKFREQVGMDAIETIMCINFIRAAEAHGEDILSALRSAQSSGRRPWKADRFMQQALTDDAFLTYDWEIEEAEVDARQQGQQANPERQENSPWLEQLSMENEVLRNTVQCLAEYLPPEIRDELEAGRRGGQQLSALVEDMDLGPSTSAHGSHGLAQSRAANHRRRGDQSIVAAADAKYFDSYSHFSIHKEMLSDKARTGAYQEAISCNSRLFNGSRVLDVGCGTGILSLLSARAGASTVIGVDGSAVMAEVASKICKANGLSIEQRGPVSILSAQIEGLTSLPVEKVDIIVSEWMGYTLLFETMLDSVLHARDRWLKPGGALLPDIATLYIAGASRQALDTEFWGSVYGFNMQPMASQILDESKGKAVVTPVSRRALVTEVASIQRFDLSTMQPEDADFSCDFDLAFTEQALEQPCSCEAIVVWFDVEFSKRFCAECPVKLSTSPFSQQTHWAQTVLPLREPVRGAGQFQESRVQGRISIARSQAHRSLDISVEYVLQDPQSGPGTRTIAESYEMAMS